METMQARSKTRFWANDDGGLDDSNKKKEMSKILNDDSEEEDDDDEEEEYQDLDTIVKKKLNETQNKKEMMSDMDFLRSKMKQNLAEEDQEEVEEQEQEQEEEEEQEEEDQVSSFKPSPRLFVGNLPYTTVEEDLLDLFNQFGEVVEVHMPLDDTKRRKGFGFVLFKNPVDAQTAMNGLNGFSFQGRVLHTTRDSTINL
jgi:multiple RNA-binding domain-containing protein 1